MCFSIVAGTWCSDVLQAYMMLQCRECESYQSHNAPVIASQCATVQLACIPGALDDSKVCDRKREWSRNSSAFFHLLVAISCGPGLQASWPFAYFDNTQLEELAHVFARFPTAICARPCALHPLRFLLHRTRC